MASINALLFHEIEEKPSSHSAVSPKIFTHCLDLIAKQKAKTITLKELNSNQNEFNESKPLYCITFDDGWRSDIEIALPELTQRGLKATFFIITSKVGTPSYVNWDEIRELKKAGMEIGSHSHTHPASLALLDDETITDELTRSKKILEDKLGDKITTLSIPHGFYNRRVIQIARAIGYDKIAISRPGINRLPYSQNTLVKRNSFHRETTQESLHFTLNPSLKHLFLWSLHYHLRSALKTILRGNAYDRFRKVVLQAKRMLH